MTIRDALASQSQEIVFAALGMVALVGASAW